MLSHFPLLVNHPKGEIRDLSKKNLPMPIYGFQVCEHVVVIWKKSKKNHGFEWIAADFQP